MNYQEWEAMLKQIETHIKENAFDPIYKKRWEAEKENWLKLEPQRGIR